MCHLLTSSIEKLELMPWKMLSKDEKIFTNMLTQATIYGMIAIE